MMDYARQADGVGILEGRFGMEIVGESTPDHPPGATGFLSSRPDEESHEIALFANPVLAHIAFKVSFFSFYKSAHQLV